MSVHTGASLHHFVLTELTVLGLPLAYRMQALAYPQRMACRVGDPCRDTYAIGERCVEYVASRGFHVPGTLGRVMKQLAEDERAREQDLLSYLLFDGAFASELMELGRQDAAAHHEELCALFEEIRGLAH